MKQDLPSVAKKGKRGSRTDREIMNRHFSSEQKNVEQPMTDQELPSSGSNPTLSQQVKKKADQPKITQDDID